jgi:hypothetical protein
MTEVHTGSCLCGRVRWRVNGPLKPVTACHCSQCRKSSGHFAAFTGAPDEIVVLEGEDGLTWYRASDAASRGFCATCGSTMFWKPDAEARIAIAAGSIDGESGLAVAKHIFCADKGDYYEITDGAVQLATH